MRWGLADELTQNIYSVYEEECLNRKTYRRSFTKFTSKNFRLENKDKRTFKGIW